MDNTLAQILRDLYEKDSENARLKEQLRQMQAEYTDLKNKLERPRSGAD